MMSTQTSSYPSAHTSLLPNKSAELLTGTTIMAIPYQGGVVLGSDSRVSTGTYIANRVSDKIAQLSEYIFACRSGSAADCQALTDYVKYYLQAHTLETGREPRVSVAAHLMASLCYDNKDKLSAGLIVAGWSPQEGGVVYQVAQGGSCLKVPFAVGGSGSMYIFGLIDASYQPNMSEEDTLTLVKKSVSHAMARDGSSGGVIRTVVVNASGAQRDYVPGNRLPFGPVGY
jgi:20S proteasome subunit beta 1